MKTIQITIDDDLLAEFDADEQVKRRGRSAVLRQVATEYIRQRKRKAITEQYQKAYGNAESPSSELACWEDEGVWPDE